MASSPTFRGARGNIGLALSWIIRRQRMVNEPRVAACEPQDQFSQLQHRELLRVPEIHRAGKAPFGFHHAQHAFDEVIDEAETAGLIPLAVNRQILASRACTMKFDTTAVAGVHPGGRRY